MNDYVFVWSINVLLQVTCVSALGLALATLTRRNSAAKYWILCSALGLMVLCPLLAAAMLHSGRSLLSVTLAPADVTRSQATAESVSGARSASFPLDVSPFTDDTRGPELTRPAPSSPPLFGPSDRDFTGLATPGSAPTRPEGHARASALPMSAHLAGEPSPRRSLATAVRVVVAPIVWGWFAGAAMLLSRMALNWWRLHVLLSNAKLNTDPVLEDLLACVGRDFNLQQLPELVISDRVTGPISVGLTRPRVVLPSRLVDDLSATHLHDILVHEVAHIVRRDQWMVLLQNVAGAIYWLHPLAHSLNRALSRAREEICDNYVLATTNAPSYSRTLLALAESMPSRPEVQGAVGLFTSKWKLESRVASLLDERRNRGLQLTNRAKLLVTALALVLTATAAVSTVTFANGEKPGQQNESRTGVIGSEADTTDATDAGPGAEAPVLRGAGPNREMLLKGRVLDVDGKPAKDFDLSVVMRKQFSREIMPTTIEDGPFEFWVPIGGDDWFHLDLSATTNDGMRLATQSLANRALRQAALDGLVLQLADANRLVTISVVQKGKPIAGAHVVAETSGIRYLRGTTNQEGQASFRLGDDEKLNYLTAWTDDHRLGGYSFHRKPRRDPLGTEHVIELEDCRNQTVRFLHAEDDSPIADVDFTLTIGTGPPNHNFPATPSTFSRLHMVTDDQGEAFCRWFPDWEKHGAYVSIISPQWAKTLEDGLKTADDGALVMKLKPRVRRKPLVGKLTSEGLDVAGLMVQIRTFQGEEERYSDHLCAFTDADGNFAADCIPGATYCFCVNDARVVSNTIDLIPYELDTGKSNTAELTVSAGEPVEIRVTSGPSRRPLANVWVHLRSIHNYSWYEDGKERGGSGGRMWGVYTDDDGVVRARALAGTELQASVNAGEWRSEERKVTVKAGEITRIAFHRESDVVRAVSGHVIAPPNSDVDIASAEVVYGSIDGETDQMETIEADADGRFAFKTRAIQLGIFVYTADRMAAGVLRPQSLDDPIEVQLLPTADLHGQLLGKNDEPLANHPVRVYAVVRGKRDFNKSFFAGFRARLFETKTDNQGNYTMKNLPSKFDMTLRTNPTDDPEGLVYLDSFFLLAGQTRPRLVSRMERTSEPDTRLISEKYESKLRDARLGDYHLLVMVFDSSSDDLVERYLMDREKTKEVMSFLNLRVREDDTADEGTRRFIESRNWPQPERGIVFACALDGTGKELGRIALDTRSADVDVQAAEFQQEHAPPQADGEEKWNAAFAEAERSGRKVWARIGQRYCGPCFRLSRWLDDNRELLERDYVFLKIDNVRDQHGDEIANRIVSDRGHFGVPFHAIFNSKEELLIDSEGPAGNIGHPSSIEGRHHLTQMLRQTRKNLTDAQIEQIVATLD